MFSEDIEGVVSCSLMKSNIFVGGVIFLALLGCSEVTSRQRSGRSHLITTSDPFLAGSFGETCASGRPIQGSFNVAFTPDHSPVKMISEELDCVRVVFQVSSNSAAQENSSVSAS